MKAPSYVSGTGRQALPEEAAIARQGKYRITSIDLLRGIVMVLMALDHARDYFYYGSFLGNPTDLATTTPLLFFTRWITHFCAPVFVFLAGTAAFLYGARKENVKQVSLFLFTRGLWLVALELTVVNFAWSFDITFSIHFLQVIWAIGLSMVCLSALVFLGKKWLLIIGVMLVAGHNLLDPIVAKGISPASILWYILHQQQLILLGTDAAVFIIYPLIPWIGLMTLGYCFGTLYQQDFPVAQRKKWLLRMGIGAVGLFLLLRAFNLYGDPNPWRMQDTFTFSVLSFLNTTKYPPSLLFLLMTMGPALLLLYGTEQKSNRITRFFIIIGRVPLFFYVLHLYVLHLLAIAGVVYAGRAWTDMMLTAQSFMKGTLATYGYSLWVVYLVWILVIACLFPLCRWYNQYKTQNRDKWWLSYL